MSLTRPSVTVTADTLHRFCKKEHDWGWKKFMELSKVLEGFTVEDTLIIKAQVQVIRWERRPARCLHAGSCGFAQSRTACGWEPSQRLIFTAAHDASAASWHDSNTHA